MRMKMFLGILGFIGFFIVSTHGKNVNEKMLVILEFVVNLICFEEHVQHILVFIFKVPVATLNIWDIDPELLSMFGSNRDFY